MISRVSKCATFAGCQHTIGSVSVRITLEGLGAGLGPDAKPLTSVLAKDVQPIQRPTVMGLDVDVAIGLQMVFRLQT